MPYFQQIINLAEAAKALSVEYIMEQLFKDKELTDYIIKLNTEDQLYDKGIDSLGKTLGQYSPNTIEGVPGRFKGKIAKHQRYDHITLKDTGAFYQSFRLYLTSNKDFQISADSIKDSVDLLVEFGKEVLGLTEQSLEKLRDMARPKIISIVRKKLNIAA